MCASCCCPNPKTPTPLRARTAAEVQEYIKANEVDFITFKAQLLMKDAQNDPIKRAALIGDMVQSITQIPDSIQRSVYVKECARLMDIDERVLVEEVARKRVVRRAAAARLRISSAVSRCGSGARSRPPCRSRRSISRRASRPAAPRRSWRRNC